MDIDTKRAYKLSAEVPSFGDLTALAELDHTRFRPGFFVNIAGPQDLETGAIGPHRDFCEKCHRLPTHQQDHGSSEFEDEGEQGGWVRCLKCPVATHWDCLTKTQREEILKLALEFDRAVWKDSALQSNVNAPKKRLGLEASQTTWFVCNYCRKGGLCMECLDAAQPPDTAQGEDVLMTDASPQSIRSDFVATIFRCFRCKRPAHYEHLPPPPGGTDIAHIIAHYAEHWQCTDCSFFHWDLDKILAWRPLLQPAAHSSNNSRNLCVLREYLVKWVGRGYGRAQWVPHMWLACINPVKLKNFLAGDSPGGLLEEPEHPAPHIVSQSSDFDGVPRMVPAPMPDAKRRIPAAWKTIERILDLLLWVDEAAAAQEGTAARDDGAQPSATLSLAEWEGQHGRTFSVGDAADVAWVFVKWDDLPYEEATWDSPPSDRDPSYYSSFEKGLCRFVTSRAVLIPAEGTPAEHHRVANGYHKLRIEQSAQLDLGQDPVFQLLDFQVDGFNWLCDNWWNRQPSILADEMGLGKTVQIAAFLGKVVGDFKAQPALVVVPNSTINNWVRELERWAPKLRVVAFYGDAKSRELIKKYELSHASKRPGFTSAKFHVLVTTYETLYGKDFTAVFKGQPRWEVLIVDEGQRLKSDASLLFRKLNELNTLHRIIMTGTPLNNNIRELFNLLNFLDPLVWNDQQSLAQQHEILTEDLIKQLHSQLRPYFLRRIKSQVLELPPKANTTSLMLQNEVIIPLSMTALQKEMYRSILSHNVDVMSNLAEPSAAGVAARGKLHNVLMHLRKCLQHPYIYDESIEPDGLHEQEEHEKMVDASAKLRFLRKLLPKLKARGRRVLLFSQFILALNVIEDFLTGEGHRFLRLDGNTKGKDRQKDIDEFNREGSDTFIFLLTTRAGGVGINLSSADTVIIYDPDFNPHQAVARAYRFGQKNTCLVFKLMVKDSAEERIIQLGKKKLVLDHLIVQTMDHEEETIDDIASILTYGAQALFEPNVGARDVAYSDADIDKLIWNTEQEAQPSRQSDGGALSFPFAKVWATERGSLEDLTEDHADSWADTLQKLTDQRVNLKVTRAAPSGRGARRAAKSKKTYQLPGSSPAQISSPASADDSGSAYGDSSDSGSPVLVSPRESSRGTTNETVPLRWVQNMTQHGPQNGQHPDSETLAHLRENVLLSHAPLEERVATLNNIDHLLHERGHLHHVVGQPLLVIPLETIYNQ
ncbi:SNF2 family N-terminal domain-containing protein [Favolaschia claudopus]|uniref:SNF2 family N-terminal domain-containing protein n=1 Tax=Favolaschia claudopus TaxID=2862362 RepID=A0AAW0E668_9AGAR